MTQKSKPPAYTNLTAAPVDFDRDQPEQNYNQKSSPESHNFRVWGVLSGTVLAVVFVIFVLPLFVKSEHSNDQTSTLTPVRPKSNISPYQQELDERYRQNIQQIIQQITEIQLELESFNVALWAPTEFQNARNRAELGDSLFQKQSYKESEQAYQSALAQMEIIAHQYPIVIRKKLEEITLALAADDLQKSRHYLDELFNIDPDNDQGKPLNRQLEVRPEVLKLLASVKVLKKSTQLTAAIALAKRANQLDPAYLPVQRILEELLSNQQTNDFQAAMSEGFLAMSKGLFDKAQTAFIKANRIKPDERAKAGLEEARRQKLLKQIAALTEKARKLEEQENWTGAATLYTRAKLLKPDSVDLAQRLEQVKARVLLDTKIKGLLKKPLELTTSRTYRSALQFLQKAKKLQTKGPIFEGQLKELSRVLTLARQPVILRLTSDSMTKVHLYRVGQYHPFSDLEIELHPGHYTALGKRRGYRDVQHNFTLNLGVDVFELEIRCEERI